MLTAPVAGTGDLISAYASRARAEPLRELPSVVSYAGLWVLLAALSPAVSPACADQLAEILGLAPDEASARAAALLSHPHPAVAGALGAWARDGLVLDPDLVASLPVALTRLPEQEVLDRWAADNTRGLIEAFPVQVTADTLLIMASALVVQVAWSRELDDDADGWLVLDDGLQVLVHTESAGVVAVAKPFTRDGVDVVSVIAAPDVPREAVWEAVAEVSTLLDHGALWHQTSAGQAGSGHAWRVREESRTFLTRDDPGPGAEVWRSRLPRWRAEATIELERAPGVAEVGEALAAGVAEPGVGLACVQSAVAAYDGDGFSAAAVTAVVVATGMPSLVERSVSCVEVTFDRPHAVVAIARGGAWEGVPLFHAWVDPAHRLFESDRSQP